MTSTRLLRLARVTLTLLTFTITSQAAFAEDAADPVAKVRTLLEARLVLMPAVAAYKWNHQLPVEDLTRESDLLDGMIAKAEKQGLSHGYAITFVSAQMEAAKAIQHRLFDHWRFAGAGKQDHERDLKADLRPKISALTEKLVRAAKAAQDSLGACSAQERLRTPPDSMEDDLTAWRIAADGVIDSRPCQ